MSESGLMNGTSRFYSREVFKAPPNFFQSNKYGFKAEILSKLTFLACILIGVVRSTDFEN
jgi:hypothetical protein